MLGEKMCAINPYNLSDSQFLNLSSDSIKFLPPFVVVFQMFLPPCHDGLVPFDTFFIIDDMMVLTFNLNTKDTSLKRSSTSPCLSSTIPSTSRASI